MRKCCVFYYFFEVVATVVRLNGCYGRISRTEMFRFYLFVPHSRITKKTNEMSFSFDHTYGTVCLLYFLGKQGWKRVCSMEWFSFNFRFNFSVRSSFFFLLLFSAFIQFSRRFACTNLIYSWMGRQIWSVNGNLEFKFCLDIVCVKTYFTESEKVKQNLIDA